jgi:hypothetical protein
MSTNNLDVHHLQSELISRNHNEEKRDDLTRDGNTARGSSNGQTTEDLMFPSGTPEKFKITRGAGFLPPLPTQSTNFGEYGERKVISKQDSISSVLS